MKPNALRRIRGRLTDRRLDGFRKGRGRRIERRALVSTFRGCGALKVAGLNGLSDDRFVVFVFLLKHSFKPFDALGVSVSFVSPGVFALKRAEIVRTASHKLLPNFVGDCALSLREVFDMLLPQFGLTIHVALHFL